MEHVIANNPIDRNRITATGISGGGWGVWELIQRHPDTFAGAIPTACGAPPPTARLAALTKTPVWTFIGKDDRRIDRDSIHLATRTLKNAGGSMMLTEVPGGHNALRPAIAAHDCFRWALAQKRGSWFAPPPGVNVHKPNPFWLVFAAYILPVGIVIFLLRDPIREHVIAIYQSVCERIAKS
jgi:dienelactone hydrolase